MTRATAAVVVALLVSTALAACTNSVGTAAQIPFVGVTHTQDSLDDYPPDQVARAKAVLDAQPMPQNQYLMGWGVDNPEPAPGEYNWSSLDQRINLIAGTHGIAVLTLAGAPDWMKGGRAGTTDWNQLDVAPARAHYDDFAALAAAAARRYPQVRYFQVWSELKGLYDNAHNRWDYEDYTDLYNAVYDAVKKVRPDAQIGGPYVVLDTWSPAGSPAPSVLSGPWGVVDQRALDVIDYWSAHKHGADFLAVDGSSGTRDAGPTTDPFGATEMFGAVSTWLRARTGLPVWWSEFYPTAPGSAQWLPGSPQLAALTVAAVANAVLGGASHLLLWQPEASGDVPNAALWTAPTADSPAAPLPLATAWDWLASNLDSDTTIDFSPDRSILLFLGRTQVLAVNLTARPVTPNQQDLPLPPYATRISPRR